MASCVLVEGWPAVLECFAGIRIGNAFAAKASKSRELALSAFAHGIGQRAMMVGEELEGRAAQSLLAHEQQGNVGTKQLQGDRGPQCLRMGECRQAVAERPIADL